MSTINPEGGIPDDPRLDLGNRLGLSLAWSGVSVTDIAEEIGKSRVTIFNWRRGKGSPSRAELKIWALRTGVSYKWLETGQDFVESGDATKPARARNRRLPKADVLTEVVALAA